MGISSRRVRVIVAALAGAVSVVALGCSTPDGGSWPFGGNDSDPDSSSVDADAESVAGDVDARCDPANYD